MDEALNDIFAKDKAIDMFRDHTCDKKTQMFEQRNYPRYLKFKLRMKKNLAIRNKMVLFCELRLLKGPLFLRI